MWVPFAASSARKYEFPRAAAATANVWAAPSSSVKMRSTCTSIMLPVGAVRTNICGLATAGVCQKLATEPGGGVARTCAGTAVDTDVSETSIVDELFDPKNSTEQVAKLPCCAGGLQTSTSFSRTDAEYAATVVFATVPIVPPIPSSPFATIAVPVPALEVNRKRWLSMTLERICGGVATPAPSINRERGANLRWLLPNFGLEELIVYLRIHT